MATKVYMEALSPTMEEGRLVTWLKNEGDAVAEGDVLAEVETDKATMELVARGEGVLRKRIIGEGDTANVGTVIAVIAAEGEDIGALVGDAGGNGASGASQPAADSGAQQDVAEATTAIGASGPSQQGGEGPQRIPSQPDAGSPASGQVGGTVAAQPQGDGGRVKASPLARRLAAEAGVEIGGVAGSGPGGRIVKRDIEGALQAAPAAAAAPAEAAAAPAPQPTTDGRDIPLTQMRKTIAKRLSQSIGPIPTFYLTIEVDMGEAMAFRKRINERFADQGIKVSPNDLVIKATAAALRKHPFVNASWTGESIRQFDAVHIGVAVAVEEGLITPVVRDAHAKSISEIAQTVRELAGRAREKKLKPEEYTGATFSISNLGMFGITEFTAVINPPEAAILAVGNIEDKVVPVNGEVAIRPRMRVTLSCDHRVIDGATGAAFLQTLKANLEDPMMMIA